MSEFKEVFIAVKVPEGWNAGDIEVGVSSSGCFDRFEFRILPQPSASSEGEGEVGDDWQPTPKNINALPLRVSQYIHDLIANSDPAGMVAENTMLRDQTKMLDVIIGNLKAAATKAVEPVGEFESLRRKVAELQQQLESLGVDDNTLTIAYMAGARAAKERRTSAAVETREGVRAVAQVVEQMEDNMAIVQWLYNPVPDGEILQWDNSDASAVTRQEEREGAPDIDLLKQSLSFIEYIISYFGFSEKTAILLKLRARLAGK